MKGMIVSIEPGYYAPGDFGVRLENLYIVTEAASSTGSSFLQFDQLTFIPFQRSLIDTHLLSARQLTWLNQYHQEVRAVVSPLLQTPVEVAWLDAACTHIE